MDTRSDIVLLEPTEEVDTRANALCAQIQTVIDGTGAPGQLPDYLVSPDPRVRELVAHHFIHAGFNVTTGFDADDGHWMRIVPPTAH